MAYSREEFHKMPKYTAYGNGDIRAQLAEFIMNFEFPRDVVSILIAALVFYITLRLLRFSIQLFASLLRPIVFVLLILIALPYLYEMKSGVVSNQTVRNVYSSTETFFGYVYNTLNSIYTHTIRFYAKQF
ncbi:uncharacterized protein LOC116339176 [Contarinia nasturtii]|uniref:uncharacterized protein LOC116339176 n=1 Tax=Contarinia nasturtii TaxID=265458 RepID=UPI0012D3CF6F|nr:uncharacterized protein LOC116339176 [Contarinia nasturtii]